MVGVMRALNENHCKRNVWMRKMTDSEEINLMGP